MRHTIEIRRADVEKADFLYNVNYCYAVLIPECHSTHSKYRSKSKTIILNILHIM